MSFTERARTYGVVLWMVGLAVLDQPVQAGAVGIYFAGVESLRLYKQYRFEKNQKGKHRVQDVAINVRQEIQ